MNILKYLSGSLIAAFVLITTNIAIAADTNSTSAVSGYVTVTSIDGDTKRVSFGDKFNDGDVINTGSESSISIALANGEVITIGALSSYTIGKNTAINNKVGGFANRSLSTKSPTLSTATSAGGIITPDAPAPTVPPAPAPAPTAPPAPTPPAPPTTPPTGGSPT